MQRLPSTGPVGQAGLTTQVPERPLRVVPDDRGVVPQGGEQVVLLDDDRRPTGVALKSGVHHASTPLHLAFSLYLFDRAGRLLLTRRAVAKKTWPGVWTNSCCGHPGPGEALEQAIHRRAAQELGIRVSGLECLLPDFAYRAVDASGTVENEVCPVFVGRTDTDPAPDPTEVEEWRWVDWADVVAVAQSTPWALSPWAAEQVALLESLHR